MQTSSVTRTGELLNLRPRRRDRFFEMAGRWFISTREPSYVGPFPNRAAAERAAEKLQAWLATISASKVTLRQRTR